MQDFFRSLVESDTILTWAREFFLALLIFGFFWVLSRLLRYFCTNWLPRIARITKTELDDRIVLRITPPVELLTLTAGLYFAVRSLPIHDRVQIVLAGMVFIANVLIFANITYRVADEFLTWYGNRVEERTGTKVGTQIFPLIRKIFTIFLVCAVLIVVLKHFGYDVLSLLTALGLGSLAIGLAAKDTLANMISGFTLMIDRPFRIGDRIQLASGKTGDVVDIGLRSTRIKTVDNTLLIIPNSELCNSTVLNMACPDMRSQGRISLGVAYGSDVDKVKSIMLETAAENPEVLQDPSPEAFFLSFGDSSLNMVLVFWVRDYTKIIPVTDQLNLLLMTAFTNNDIQIPYPTRKVLLEREG
ncbi:MAG: mechanosensitive ion channel family protein [Deltaproteobacteria bacterium]|nr:mechanosensitive ion channel family protein [Deltaproteobacteria bacterium]TLN03747.1 MAG: mechanosensitive ion channel family protein [bacterium]